MSQQKVPKRAMALDGNILLENTTIILRQNLGPWRVNEIIDRN